MDAYRITELLEEIHKRKKEIESIYNRKRLIEKPLSKNFYIDEYYTYNQYPIFGLVKGCKQMREKTSKIQKLNYNNLKKREGKS